MLGPARYMVLTAPQHLWITGLKTSAPVGPGISAQPGLYYRGVFRPLVLPWVGGTARCNYQLGPPPLPEGHGVSLAYSCLLDVVRSVSLVVDTQPQEEEGGQGEPWADIHTVRVQLLQSSWQRSDEGKVCNGVLCTDVLAAQ